MSEKPGAGRRGEPAGDGGWLPRGTQLAIAATLAAAVALGWLVTDRLDIGAAVGSAAVVVLLLGRGIMALVALLSRGKVVAPEKRPPFAANYPRTPEMDRLLAAFRAGDYAYVRREAPAVAERSDDEGVKRAALDLRRRLEPEPVALYLLGLGVALLLALYGYYLQQSH